LQDNEKMILDNHHLVALSENSNYRVMKFGGLKTTILGGEGLVTEKHRPRIGLFPNQKYFRFCGLSWNRKNI